MTLSLTPSPKAFERLQRLQSNDMGAGQQYFPAKLVVRRVLATILIPPFTLAPLPPLTRLHMLYQGPFNHLSFLRFRLITMFTIEYNVACAYGSHTSHLHSIFRLSSRNPTCFASSSAFDALCYDILFVSCSKGLFMIVTIAQMNREFGTQSHESREPRNIKLNPTDFLGSSMETVSLRPFGCSTTERKKNSTKFHNQTGRCAREVSDRLAIRCSRTDKQSQLMSDF